MYVGILFIPHLWPRDLNVLLGYQSHRLQRCHPACDHEGSAHLSPVPFLNFTTRQPKVEFYLLTFPRFPHTTEARIQILVFTRTELTSSAPVPLLNFTTRQLVVGFYLLAFSRFPLLLGKPGYKSWFSQEPNYRTNVFRTGSPSEFYNSSRNGWILLAGVLTLSATTREARIQILVFTRIEPTSSVLVGVRGYLLLLLIQIIILIDHSGDEGTYDHRVYSRLAIIKRETFSVLLVVS